MIYLDTSAAAKVVLRERESLALRGWLDGQADPAVSSVITKIELTRAAARRGDALVSDAEQTLGRLALLDVSDDIVERACVVGGPHLRSLDAIHLATALRLAGDLTSFVTYDRQLGRAALDAGLPVVSPGCEL